MEGALSAAEVNSQDTVMTQVLLELEKVQLLLRQVHHIYSITDDISNELKLLKKPELEGELLKLKNVIEDKVSGTLTTNERKRYENIGKQFVEGAGKLFARIKQAIKLKENMKTSQDKFVLNIKKGKETTKKVVKKSGFWKKFLAVIAIIGVVGLLFKDKIAKLIPDFTQSNEGFLASLKSNMARIIDGLLSYISDIAGSSVTGIIRYVSENIIPSLVGDFFNITLPRSIVATVLTMLSVFSSSAENELQSFLGEDIQNHAEDTAERADEQRRVLLSGGKLITEMSINRDFQKQSLEELEALALNWYGLVADEQGMWDAGGLMTMLDEQFTETDLRKYAHLIDYKALSDSIANAAADGLTESEIRAIISDRLKGIVTLNLLSHLNVTDAMGLKMTEYYSAASRDFSSLQSKIIELRRIERETRLNSRSGNEELLESNPTVSLTNTPALINLVKVDIANVIGAYIGQNLKTVFESFGLFLGVQLGSHAKIVETVGTYFNYLGEVCSSFFVKSMDVIDAVLRNVYATYWSRTQGTLNLGTNNTDVSSIYNFSSAQAGSNFVLINIDIDDVFIRNFSSIMTGLGAVEHNIFTLIVKGNGHLNSIIIGLGVLGRRGTGRSLKESFDNLQTGLGQVEGNVRELEAKVQTNTTNIATINEKLNPQPQPATTSGVANTLNSNT